jgi:hypothetical protein
MIELVEDKMQQLHDADLESDNAMLAGIRAELVALKDVRKEDHEILISIQSMLQGRGH